MLGQRGRGEDTGAAAAVAETITSKELSGAASVENVPAWSFASVAVIVSESEARLPTQWTRAPGTG
jgi:hypothetical protein